MSASHDPEPRLRTLLERHVGAVSDVRPTRYGFGTDLTALVTGDAGRFFVKAMRNRPGGRRDQMVREGAVNGSVRSLAPRLRWQGEDERWIVLGFEAVDGRLSEFTPGSPDLPTVVDLVNRIGALPLPEVAREWREIRWDWWADLGAADLFRGDTVLHADVNPDNFLIGEERSWVVDWSWPTRGAAFIDPAMLVLHLVASGHTPQDAEKWASGCTAWAEADARAIDAFVIAYARMLRHHAARRPGEPWRRATADAAFSWVDHRRLVVG